MFCLLFREEFSNGVLDVKKKERKEQSSKNRCQDEYIPIDANNDI